MEPNRPAVQIVEIDEENGGQRVDNYLCRELKGVPKSHIYKLLRRGEVRLNGGRIKASTRLTAGDSLRIPPIRMRQRGAPEASGWLQTKLEESIIYEDKVMLVLNKPAGIAVHGGSGISAGVIEGLRARRPDDKHLELVHRLDRDTSGCLMIAKRRSALRFLQGELRSKTRLRKHYLVIVHGRWSKRRQQVDAPLEKNTLKSGERISRVNADGKACLTRFELLATNGEFSLLAAEPVTGRTHQIRVHCAIMGHPVVGDAKYGDEDKDKQVRARGFKRMMLHARRLEIPPMADDGEMLVVEAAPDAAFQELADYIKTNKL